MATTAEPQTAPPATAGEGEFKLGKPSTPLVSLDSVLTAKISKLAEKGGGGLPAKAAETPPEAPTPPTTTPKTVAAKEPTVAPKVETVAAKTETVATPKAEEPAKAEEPSKGGPKQLREAYERAQARLTEVETTIGATTKEKLEALQKLAKAEEQLTLHQKRITEELEPLRKVHEEQSKRLQEREEALMLARYEATDEYHTTFVKPITDVQAEAMQFVGELVVQTGDGKEVPASQEHLNYVLSAPNNNEAARRAEQLLGQGSPFVGQLVNYRTRLRALEVKRQEGLKQGQLKAREHFERQQVQMQQAQQQFREKVHEAFKGHLLKPAENDPEEAGALQAGMQFADELDAAAESGNPDLWAGKLAQARADVANKRLLETRNKRLAAENEALRKQLAAYAGSEPGVGTRNSGEAPPSVEVQDDLTGSATAHLQKWAEGQFLKRVKR